MLTERLNELFCSKHINEILYLIAKTDDLRMCLNKDVINSYRHFFANIILLSSVIEISPEELKEIYIDAEKFLSKKLSSKLKLKDVYKRRDAVEKYFNSLLGNTKYLFHGTTSYMLKYFTNNLEKSHVNIEQCKIINDIYEKHGIYLAFQSGIRDYNADNFFVTTSPSSTCFYSLQSPEYFARFASRSDYYKQDIFKYDRIAYYRKDYFACRNNVKKEMKEFSFNRQEKQVVLKNFKIIWDNIVFKYMKNIILFKEIEENNIQHFKGNESLMEMLLRYFNKVNFVYNFNEFKTNIKEIVLPDIKDFLTRQHPIFNKKFVIINNKKCAHLDFYVDCKYSGHKYYTFKNNLDALIHINPNPSLNEYTTLIQLVNEAKPNTCRAKKFFKRAFLPTINDVINFYKKEFEDRLKQLQLEKDMSIQTRIIKDICEDVGLKYIVSLKYKQYFKNVSTYYIYQYRKYLGVKLFEHYEGIPIITPAKIKALIKLYKEILESKDFVLKTDVPFKIFNNEIKVIK